LSIAQGAPFEEHALRFCLKIVPESFTKRYVGDVQLTGCTLVRGDVLGGCGVSVMEWMC
jgi:hypothetical protein